MAPWIRPALVALLVLSAGCDSQKPTLVLQPTAREIGGHLPPEVEVTLRTAAGVTVVSKGAFFAALGPDDRVAFVDLQGLHLWRRGEAIRIAAASPRGMASNSTGVVFTSAAESGPGSGLSMMTWDGVLTTLVPAPEGLPGQAGLLNPAINADGRYAYAFSDLSPRPSLHRVDLRDGTTTQLAAEVPPAVGKLSVDGDRLSWFTGEQQVFVDAQTGEVLR